MGKSGLFGTLGIVFVILKLCEVIQWSWVWVLLPFWGGLAFHLATAGLVLLIAIIAETFKR